MKSRLIERFAIGTVISILLAVMIGSSLAYAMNVGVKKLPIKQYFSPAYNNAIWDWSNIESHTAVDLRDTADFLYMHQINTVYVDVGAAASISQNINSAQKQYNKQKLNESLEAYIKAMEAHHIRVFASAGNTDWSKPSLRSLPLSIQKFAFNYNQTHSAKLAGLEFDIEAYNQIQFVDASFTEKELVLDEYLDMLDVLASTQSAYTHFTHDKNFELGFAIPYWFDNENLNIKSVSWHEKTGPVLFHILDRLNKLPHSNVVVMAYRNAALGNDGIIYHSRTELEYAQSKTPNVKVLLGAEVNDVEPKKITFYGRSYVEVSSEVKLVQSEFKHNRAYSGVAINDLVGYKAIGEVKAKQ